MSVFEAGLVLDGRYRLERPIAEGAVSAVWVGHQIALEREVAVKLLRIDSSAPLRARLRREALALAAVHHPSVVQVFDYGEAADGSPYLVMELVRGEALGARIARKGAFAAADAVMLVLPMLEGLAAAHRAGVIHRDIKPDNVLLSAGPSGPLPKLLDFGIARMDRAHEARLTADGGFLGTPAYMAPEQVRGAAVDERADVWGMAALLYEMIAGRSPFGVDDIVSVIRRVIEQPPPYPPKARGLDATLWSALTSALRKDPAERTPSALAFHASLAAWLEAQGFGPVSHPSFRPASSPTTRGPGEARPPADSIVDADADTAPVPSLQPPFAFDAMIRAKAGES